MSAAMKSMNLEKISTLMDNFEKEFEVMLWDGYSDNVEGTSKATYTEPPPPSHLGISWTLHFVAHLLLGQNIQASWEEIYMARDVTPFNKHIWKRSKDLLFPQMTAEFIIQCTDGYVCDFNHVEC